MSDLQKIIVLCVVAALGAVGAVWYQNAALDNMSDEDGHGQQQNAEEVITEAEVAEFTLSLEETVRLELSQPIEGYEPFMFMEVYPGLIESDFDGVEAEIGQYLYDDSQLRHEVGETDMLHSAAPAVSNEGMLTLLLNVYDRLPEAETVTEVLTILSGEDQLEPEPDPNVLPIPTPEPELPESDEEESANEETVCTDEMKSAEACPMIYAPVCGLVEVQCITAPCDPVPETFGNGCEACARGNVISYTEGACSAS